jgi:glycosidase
MNGHLSRRDFVASHCSSENQAFQAALADQDNAPTADWFHFRHAHETSLFSTTL